jgi:ribonucleoside-triphosphate reductase (thioredoxin)
MSSAQETQKGSVTAISEKEISKEAQAILNYARETQSENLSNKVPEKVKELAEESKQYFRNQLAEFVYYRTYSRWIESEGRRETWIETVDRYVNFMKENLGNKLTKQEYEEVREAILRQEAMPSMRLLQFAGDAARSTNVSAYNCSFIAPTKLKDFADITYILMCGSGVGFTVETETVEALPQIKRQSGERLENHVVEDSREGWADALLAGLKAWYAGKDLNFDYSLVRPAGARLKTFGGRASGPGPLIDLINFTRQKVLSRQGKRLRSIDVHDVICKIGEVVVAGGVRRSALISLSDLDDKSLRDAKVGQFWNTEPQRAMSNNSAVYNEKPSVEKFMTEWMALIESGSGERGIFNRDNLKKTLPSRRKKFLKTKIEYLGTNPCAEILLQSKQFCNLSEIVARADDTEETLERKMRVAAILGTYQSTLTSFPYISKDWKQNCDQERLLGVSITGQWDSPTVRQPEVMRKLKKIAVSVNKEYAQRFGISQSTCVTCVKPSGNLSQTVDSASGLHVRYAPYYIRRVRINATDPLFHMLQAQGVPAHPENGQTEENATTWVLEFPVKAPDQEAKFKDDITALEQLEYWKVVKENYTEHNPSVTVYVKNDEWLEVANWVYKNWDIVGGLSFLPSSDHIYSLAPYEAIDVQKYEELKEKIGEIDYAQLVLFEKTDHTENKKELACVGGACEI